MIRDKKSVTGYSPIFINKKVEYKRYMTLKEGVRNTLVTYELIGLIVFAGRSLNVGHYYAYVLNSDNKWYKMDDLKPNEVPVTAYEACNQQLPYIFFFFFLKKKFNFKD
jgi:ubiquitin C-terminal hydrolase